MKLRDYQVQIKNQAFEILVLHKFVYLAMEVRTGKTLTSLAICEDLGVENVLFITKKKAISSIEADYKLLNPNFNLSVINYESLHKIDLNNDYNLIICDEAHSMGAYARASNRALAVKKIIKLYNPYVILLSGTPTPESYSQMYHQVFGIPNNPFAEFSNFYKFARQYVNITTRKINSNYVNDYSKGLPTILEAMKPYTISYTQKEAGFEVKTNEQILHVRMDENTYGLTARLKKDLVIQGKTEVILADTAVKLMMKLHQLFSGTIKFESGNSMVVDFSKAKYIKDKFGDKKIGIFYKFKEELNAIKKIFGDSITTDLSIFEDTDKSIALQIVSGREGISLKQADALVYYNIDFSATSYWQSRDRMTTKERIQKQIYWVFSSGGIEEKIYKAVTKKKDYTLNHFRRDFY